MADFLKVIVSNTQKGIIVTPEFQCGRVRDIMVKGGRFYAFWNEDTKTWITDWNSIPEFIDAEINKAIAARGLEPSLCNKIYYARSGDSQVMNKFKNYTENQLHDYYIPLNSKLVFKSDPYERDNYSTLRLSYDVAEGSTYYFDKIAEKLYSKTEREKWMWAIGSIIAGDSPKIQKFFVFYGSPGKGKSTVIHIIEQLFEGYYSVFQSEALANKKDQFSMAPFKNNPLVAVEHEGNLSRVSDNSRLNSIVSHERMIVNEKNVSQYEMKMQSMLFIASNEPVDITSTKSGLMRRLVDIFPTGKILPVDEYEECMDKIPFELGAIAYKCLQVYLSDKKKYNNYKPGRMIVATNSFYNFVLENRDTFEAEPYTLRKVAYERYKKYCEDSGIKYPLNATEFGLELQNFFDEFHSEYRDADRVHRSFVYKGFKSSIFELDEAAEQSMDELNEADAFSKLPEWLRLEKGDPLTNVFNRMFSKAKAQYAVKNKEGTEQPKYSWDNVETKLSDILTTQVHYVLPGRSNLVVIDFDLTVDGDKNLARCLEAAAKFPKTYAEVSKGGGGLHLHYIYDGDPDELSALFDTGIEIKVFRGKASLRRRLSLCNNEEITHLSSGLPLKEVKKVISFEGIENEKHLRALINKGLEKKVHADTRSSIDYINKILTDAYESGLKYDVSDLRHKVMNFAANSTHQSEYCMAKVCEMPFMSEDPSENVETKVYLEKPIAFFDCEVFKNLFIICYKVEGGIIGEAGKSEVKKMINPSANDVQTLIDSYRLIGFNNINYDNHILYARILGYSNLDLYNLSTHIVGNVKGSGFRESKNLSYTDVYDFSNTKQSLKKWEIQLKLHHQEFPLKWDQEVPEDMFELAADYCANDVVATEAVFYHLEADWDARQILASVSGLTVNDLTNAHSTRIIFGNNRKPQGAFNYPDLSKEFPGYEFNPYGIDESRYNIGFDGKSVKSSGKSIFMGDDPSEGGYVYFEPGIHYNVALLDVASLHPTTIEVLELFGPEYTKRFSEIKSARIAVKHKDWAAARVYLDGALAPFLEGMETKSADEQQALSDKLAYALKIVINSIYGLTSASFPNPCKDPRNVDNCVAKRGALFMILLKHEVQKRGYTVAHVKTDSIKIVNADDEIIEFVMGFGKKYGYTFEHEATYAKFCLLNKSVYIAKYDEYGERTKGGKHANQWTPTGAEFQHPYIFKTLFSHEPITFDDYCEMKQVSGSGAMYLDQNEKLTEGLQAKLYSLEREYAEAKNGKMAIRKQINAVKEEIEQIHNLRFIGRCGLFVPVVEGNDGGHLLRIDGEKVGSVSGTKGYRWLEAAEVIKNGLEDQIDMSYYRKLIDTSIAHIAAYGDVEEFLH